MTLHEPRRAATEIQEPRRIQHVGLIISGVLTIFLLFKILAVAGWNPNTAMGIVAASGTTNVLISAAFTILPTMYGFLVIAALPRINERVELRKRNSTERAAFRMLETWPFTILMFIVPFYLVFGILLLLGLEIASKTIARRRSPKKAPRPEDGIGRFEANSVAVAAAVWLVFTGLASPWLPTEIVRTNSEQSMVGYVLSSDGGTTVVLLDRPRRLERFDTAGLMLQYCEKPSQWVLRPPVQLFSNPAYPPCPAEG